MLKSRVLFICFINEIFFTINYCFMKLRDSGVALMGHVVKLKKKFILQVDEGKLRFMLHNNA